MNYDGSEARARFEYKRAKILQWILRFSYTDQRTVASLLGLKASAAADTLAALRRDGLIEVYEGYGTLCRLYRLTPSGAREADQHRGEYDIGLKAMTNPADFGVHYSRHNLVAQRLAAVWSAEKGHIGEVLSPRQIRLHGLEIGSASYAKSGHKVPDALLIEPVAEDQRAEQGRIENRIAVEIQQSSEARDTRAYKLWQYWVALREEQISRILYCSTYPTLVDHYRKQWRLELEEREYWVERHKWITPTNPARIDPTDPRLKDGRFLDLPHEQFGVGLYAPPPRRIAVKE